MGIDKSLKDGRPIAVIDGTVYQYGKLPDYVIGTNTRRKHPQWLVEHHSYAKDNHCFGSEEAMLRFLQERTLNIPADPAFRAEEWLYERARRLINAVLDWHLFPLEGRSDSEILRQVRLIIDDAERQFHEATKGQMNELKPPNVDKGNIPF